MHVLYLTREFPPHVYGGAGVHLAQLSRCVSRRHDVSVFAFGKHDGAKGADGIGVRGFSPDPELRESASRLPALSALEALSANVRFAAAAAAVDADVVHAHTWYANLGGYLVKTIREVPLVLTIHSLEPLRPWKRDDLGTGFDVSSWMEKTAIEAADAVIAVSGSVRKDVLDHFEADPDRVHVIPNGVDSAVYRRVPETEALVRRGIDPTQPHVLFVGRITRQKGIAHLLEAVRRLPREIGLVLCATSADAPEVRSEIARRVKDLAALGRRVHWIDEMIPVEESVQLYSHATVFCCPSIYEPFGIINLEAMACGTPVVASAVGGILEVVKDGENGVLVPLEVARDGSGEPTDPSAFAGGLADALLSIIENPKTRERLGAAGRRHVEKRYSWDAVALSTEDLYGRLTKK